MPFEIEIFAVRLRELRAKHGLNVSKLGYALNIEPSLISKWELEKSVPRVERIYELAKFFNVTAGYLIGLED